jgi:hypothetical protein
MEFLNSARSFVNSTTDTITDYKNADLPLAIKIAIPITLSASAIVGGAGIGIAG